MFVGENGSVTRPDITLFAILILYSFGSQPVHQAAHICLLTCVTMVRSSGLPRQRPWLTYRDHAYKNTDSCSLLTTQSRPQRILTAKSPQRFPSSLHHVVNHFDAVPGHQRNPDRNTGKR